VQARFVLYAYGKFQVPFTLGGGSLRQSNDALKDWFPYTSPKVFGTFF
jgi:hypothetical protein